MWCVLCWSCQNRRWSASVSARGNGFLTDGGFIWFCCSMLSFYLSYFHICLLFVFCGLGWFLFYLCDSYFICNILQYVCDLTTLRSQHGVIVVVVVYYVCWSGFPFFFFTFSVKPLSCVIRFSSSTNSFVAISLVIAFNGLDQDMVTSFVLFMH